jgi:hypothetical protein
LQGLNVVLGVLPLPLTRWPGPHRSVPVGRALSLQDPPAHQRNVPDRSRRQLARALLDCVAEQWPGRPLRSRADGGDATKAYGRRWPQALHLVGRFPSRAKLYEVPPPRPPTPRGAPRTKGALLGSPQTLAQTATGWAPHPSDGGAARQAWDGLGHAVLPGRLVRGVGLRRPGTSATTQPGPRKPPPAIAAFFTTDLALSAAKSVRA